MCWSLLNNKQTHWLMVSWTHMDIGLINVVILTGFVSPWTKQKLKVRIQKNMILASGRPKKEAAQGTALQRTRGERSSQKQSRINSRKLWKQSQTRQGSPEPAPVVNNLPQHATELSFSIKRALGARWDLTLSKSTTRPNILNWCPDWNSYL